MTCNHTPTQTFTVMESLSKIRHKLSNITMGLYAQDSNTQTIAIDEISKLISIIDFLLIKPSSISSKIDGQFNNFTGTIAFDTAYLTKFVNLTGSSLEQEDECLILISERFTQELPTPEENGNTLLSLAIRTFVSNTNSFLNFGPIKSIHIPLERGKL